MLRVRILILLRLSSSPHPIKHRAHTHTHTHTHSHTHTHTHTHTCFPPPLCPHPFVLARGATKLYLRLVALATRHAVTAAPRLPTPYRPRPRVHPNTHTH